MSDPTANGYSSFTNPNGKRVALVTVGGTIGAIVESSTDPEQSTIYANFVPSPLILQGSPSDLIDTINGDNEGAFVGITATLKDGRRVVFQDPTNYWGAWLLQEVDDETCMVISSPPLAEPLYLEGSYDDLCTLLKITGTP